MLHFNKPKMEAAIHSRARSDLEVRTPRPFLYGNWDTFAHILKGDLKKNINQGQLGDFRPTKEKTWVNDYLDYDQDELLSDD